MEMEQEYFGAVFNDEDLEDELLQLDADLAEMEIPDAPFTYIEPVHNEKVDQEVAKPKQKAPQRELVNAWLLFNVIIYNKLLILINISIIIWFLLG